MSEIKRGIFCRIRVKEIPLHLYQLIAGFSILEQEGIITTKFEIGDFGLNYNMMEVIINDNIRVLYDVNDGYDNLIEGSYIEFMDNILSNYDICFKRSFSEEYNKKLKNGYKIRPLGLNYMVTIKGNFAHKPVKFDPQKEKIKKIIRALPLSQYYNNKYLINRFEQEPIYNENPKILFMARLWDENLDIRDKKNEERVYINNTRIKCLEKCKKEFGDIFTGGLSADSYSLSRYSNLVIKNKELTRRDKYLKLMHSHDICIATTGLHESIGWKFGEYVAASRAIVSEKLNYELPGDFSIEKNYLDFKNVDQCIDNIYTLLKDHKARYEMMKNNYKYYQDYVKPNKLILNTIMQCI